MDGRGRDQQGRDDDGQRRARAGILALLCAMAVLLPGSDAHAWELLKGEGYGLNLGGYVQSAGGVVRPGIEGDATYGGLHGQALRLQWRASLGGALMVEFDQRLLSRVVSGALLEEGGSYGLGSSVTPARSVDWEWNLIDEPGVRLTHDVDRLVLRYFASWGEVVVGRQAITWGNSILFPVADVWAQFSPLELDQTEKPGVDAARVLLYPGAGVELDMVISDRGGWEDASFGLRASRTIGDADVSVGGGRFWKRAALLLGVSYDFSEWKARAQGYVPLERDERTGFRPRVTLGADVLRRSWVVGAEYHYNGTGVSEAERYLEPAVQEALARGESYYLGQHYVGAIVGYQGEGRLQANVTAQVNVLDGSVLVGPSLFYALSDHSDVSFGAFEGIGERVSLLPQPEIGSEFGAYGGFYYLQFRGFF
ncbi:hypothetical protein EA187_09805 [Lujinxingia sediminis]|uniref:Porin n=1 Tax=Lujinxingia sediminis TaxID=2480984 RepID=A0ABY0CT91_9DELT|nr:hypothetical protein [Lujinxingia sediminis]RVU44825.1 hypothetical protein EA187_09805 [Lujinxingia sediminis]